MGSWSRLKLANIEFGGWKDRVDDSILVLFSESEKRIGQRAAGPDDEILDDSGEQPNFLKVEYVTSIEVLKKRLDFLGFTLNTCRRMFDIAKEQELRERRRWIEDLSPNFDTEAKQKLNEYYAPRIELLSGADADTWICGLREAFLAPPGTDPEKLSELANSFRPVGPLPFPRYPGDFDDRFRLRFELEALQVGEAVLDITDLIDGGYCLASDPLASWAREWVHARDRETLHLVVLTEGATDKFVLESAFRVLRPELVEYVSFMDFAAFKVEGGASFLVNMVRSFAGAGIRDRIVAIFDNDTAGCSALAALSKQKLPENIKVMRYPDIELARKYPTHGPSGEVVMDVNGTGASIELYLGRDVLAQPDGILAPVQWRALDPTMKRYQGEVVNKRECMARFSEKISRLDRSDEPPVYSEWSELRVIVDAICLAFEEADREFLLTIADEAESV
jgi:hypothetical protein